MRLKKYAHDGNRQRQVSRIDFHPDKTFTVYFSDARSGEPQYMHSLNPDLTIDVNVFNWSDKLGRV